MTIRQINDKWTHPISDQPNNDEWLNYVLVKEKENQKSIDSILCVENQ